MAPRTPLGLVPGKVRADQAPEPARRPVDALAAGVSARPMRAASRALGLTALVLAGLTWAAVASIKRAEDVNQRNRRIDSLRGTIGRLDIIVTPTLVKVSPSPRLRVLGNLKNGDALLHLLGIERPRPEST
jgi:hypothetical protein